MSEPIQAYPLQWPPGWRRIPSHQRKHAQFHKNNRILSVSDGAERVLTELARLGVKRDDLVISTDIPTRLDGLPRSDHIPRDPGAAVYWRKGKDTRCMAVDRYNKVADNLAAIAATLEAMRAIERHGGAEILDRAFTGFTALPAPEQWFTILGVSANASVEEIKLAHRRLVAANPEFRTGGAASDLARINTARDEGLSQRS